jgi:hypothetical protein
VSSNLSPECYMLNVDVLKLKRAVGDRFDIAATVLHEEENYG